MSRNLKFKNEWECQMTDAVKQPQAANLDRIDQMLVSLPKTRYVRTGDAIRPRLHGRRCPRRARSGAGLAHPFRAKHEDATHCNRWRISQESAEDALR